MFIIPIQNKPDWSRPPLVTIGLIVLNILIFVLYQGDDTAVVDRASALYTSNNLLEVERPYYVQYLQKNRPDDWATLEQNVPEKTRSDYLFWAIFYDRGFDQHLQQLWEQPKQIDLTMDWRRARDAFEQERNQLSSIEAGLTPAEAKPWTFLSSMFLHGGWDHLLGNMLFLFLFGFTLEGALRVHLYLGMYLASGFVASGLFVLFNQASHMPLVGASGAISGLMGMYLSLYRLRRIRFFYSILFYFGEITAPALLILPLWLAKELYGHFFIDSNVAYWAHIGGLLAGASLMYFASRSQRNFAEVEDANDQARLFDAQLKAVQVALSQLDHQKARVLARGLCRQYPLNFSAWRALFNLHKLQPQQREFHQAVFDTLKQFVAPQTPYAEWQPHMQTLLKEYAELAPTAPALNGPMYIALARKTWDAGSRHRAEDFLRKAAAKKADARTAEKLLNDIQAYYRSRGQSSRGEGFRQLFANTPARAARPPKKPSAVD